MIDLLCSICVAFLETTIAEELFDLCYSINCWPTYIQVSDGNTPRVISETSTYYYYASQSTSDCVLLLTLYFQFLALPRSVSELWVFLPTHFHTDLWLSYERQASNLFHLLCFSSQCPFHIESDSTCPLYLLNSCFAIQLVCLYCLRSNQNLLMRKEGRVGWRLTEFVIVRMASTRNSSLAINLMIIIAFNFVLN